jgi:hypothetical protein
MIPTLALTLADHALGIGDALVRLIPPPDPEHRAALRLSLREARLVVVRSRIERRARQGHTASLRLTRREARLSAYLRERGRTP